MLQILRKNRNIVRIIALYANFIENYFRDMRRYLKYSRTLHKRSLARHLSVIIQQYHVLEKGLTMPEPRLGFGKANFLALKENCVGFLQNYGGHHAQLIHAIRVLREYIEFHESSNYKLDAEIYMGMEALSGLTGDSIHNEQLTVSIDEYFRFSKSSFSEFALSRHSVRNFSDCQVSMEVLFDAINLANHAPSACNRQPWKTYIFAERAKIDEILLLQGGNRGFGHLTNKLMIVSCDLSVYSSTNERNQGYIDGGIFSMNLLYSLHYYKIGACILNCSFDFNLETRIKQLSNIGENEILIAMIAVGYPPEEFKIASSPKNDCSLNSFTS